MPDHHYTVRETAELLAVDDEQVLHHISSGEIVAVNVAKAGAKRPSWRISESEIGKFCLRRQTKPAERTTEKPKRVRRGSDASTVPQYV